MTGIQTKNLPLRQSLNELIGNDSQDSTARITLQALSRLIGHDIAQEIAATGGVGIFATANAGVSATEPGQYFAVAGNGDDYLILYQNVSGSAQEISRAPSVEAVAALESAILDGLSAVEQSVETLVGEATLATNWDAITRSGFYRGAGAASTIGVPADHAHIGLLHIEKGGARKQQLAFRQSTDSPQMWMRNFSDEEWGEWKELALQESLEKSLGLVEEKATAALSTASEPQGLMREFFTAPAEQQRTTFAVADKSGRALLRVRDDGVQQLAWRGEFHVEAGAPLYAWVDSDQRIFYAVDDSGAPQVGGGIDPNHLPNTAAIASPGQVYLDYQTLRRVPTKNSFFPISPLTVMQNTSDLYDRFDVLVSEFPDYLKKTVIGQDGLGNDIIKYTATPASYWTRWYDVNEPSVLQRPKVVLFGAMHGGEKRGATTNYQFLRELCYRWQEDDRLAYLRWGMELHLVPILNPSGFNANDRYNHNGVDLNRNFPFGWEDATPQDRRGSAPASEAETQIALTVINDNLDACAFIDHHNAGSLNREPEPYAYWIGTERPETIEIARMSCDHMMRFVRKTFPYVDQYNSKITRLVDSFPGTLTKHVQGELDRNGFTLETGGGFNDTFDRQLHAMEALVNLIHMCVQAENTRRIRETDFVYP